ncbi:MAG: GAF domain-containing protein, partial [Nitrospira sp.]|nr:GAF domain-containing protein [Nitrospira sp.]
MSGLLREKEVLFENEKLKTDLSAIRRELNFYETVCRSLISSTDLKTILTTIMKKVKEMIKAKSWSILLVDEDSGNLVLEKAEGLRTQKVNLKIGEDIAGLVAQKCTPLLVTDLSQDKRFFGKTYKPLNAKTKSLICVPIKSRDQLLGVLEFSNKTTGEPFTQKDLNVLMKLIDQIAIAIERVSLSQKVAELTVTDDLTK